MAAALLNFTADAELLQGFARALAPDLRAGDTVLLDGPVGAGKSHFARALIRARLQNPGEEVPSPTFTLVQTYDGQPPIWHADLYRLTDASEIDELGLTDALPDSIALIEWPDRMNPPPPEALRIDILSLPDPDRRQVALSGPEDLGRRARRAAERAVFLQRAGWTGAEIAALAGDASARRYFQLAQGDRTAVLMDSDRATVTPYLSMTDWLAARDFTVPQILAADPESGLALIEDFGDAPIARVIGDDPSQTAPLYDRIAGMLARLAGYDPAPGLLVLDGAEMARQLELFAEWYPAAAGADAEAMSAARAIAPCFAALHDRLCADATPVTGLRDCHAENIFLTPDGRLGLIDFQDAVAVHPAYDLVSVLHDARRAIAAEVEEAAIVRFLRDTGFDRAAFEPAFALLGVQRNLRILGIFTRLCLRDGKPRYLRFVPHLWSLIERELAHPALADLAALVRRLPVPDQDVIERIRSQCTR